MQNICFLHSVKQYRYKKHVGKSQYQHSYVHDIYLMCNVCISRNVENVELCIRKNLLTFFIFPVIALQSFIATVRVMDSRTPPDRLCCWAKVEKVCDSFPSIRLVSIIWSLIHPK